MIEKDDNNNNNNNDNPAPVLENDSHKLLWGFNIQTDHLIPARPHNNQQKKENLKNC